ncbi:MAG: recombination protein RecR [Candidatus Kerfeldbacteria bacterium]|nr:recombination protein RecR [Candidatus Kerfeldbacteria bacterium]
MKRFADAIQELLDHFAQFPGIGPKSAERFVFYLLSRPPEEVTRFAKAIERIRSRVHRCSVCFDFGETDPCAYCSDSSRDASTVCVVAGSPDVLAIEKTGEYNGRYHVLGGVLRPTAGITPDRLRIRELIDRVQKNGINEVILATNPDLEGEATALYITQQLKPTGVKVTRLAKGLPMGSDVEYADEVTLANALKGRRSMNGA